MSQTARSPTQAQATTRTAPRNCKLTKVDRGVLKPAFCFRTPIGLLGLHELETILVPPNRRSGRSYWRPVAELTSNKVNVRDFITQDFDKADRLYSYCAIIDVAPTSNQHKLYDQSVLQLGRDGVSPEGIGRKEGFWKSHMLLTRWENGVVQLWDWRQASKPVNQVSTARPCSIEG